MGDVLYQHVKTVKHPPISAGGRISRGEECRRFPFLSVLAIQKQPVKNNHAHLTCSIDVPAPEREDRYVSVLTTVIFKHRKW
ncbi:hypothetical protein C0J52_11183 [Blattella germanica]|nr:hypothetical protein C0J52_11183 [Blattella germanica]